MSGQKGGWKNAFFIFFTILILTLAYAIVRYNIVRNVPVDQIPLYITNKAIALTATLLIGLSFLLGPFTHFWPKKFENQLYLQKYLGVFGFGIAALHAIMSLMIFSPSYYPRYFDTVIGKMTLGGESAVLFGILAFFVFSVITVTSLPSVEEKMHPTQWKFVQRLGYLAFFFVLLHVAVLGYKGWFNPESYTFGLISIGLITALFIIFVLVMRAIVAVFPGHKQNA